MTHGVKINIHKHAINKYQFVKPDKISHIYGTRVGFLGGVKVGTKDKTKKRKQELILRWKQTFSLSVWLSKAFSVLDPPTFHKKHEKKSSIQRQGQSLLLQLASYTWKPVAKPTANSTNRQWHKGKRKDYLCIYVLTHRDIYTHTHV